LQLPMLITMSNVLGLTVYGIASKTMDDPTADIKRIRPTDPQKTSPKRSF